MGINTESDIAANLQIGPTDLGMVRIYVSGVSLATKTPKNGPQGSTLA